MAKFAVTKDFLLVNDEGNGLGLLSVNKEQIQTMSIRDYTARGEQAAALEVKVAGNGTNNVSFRGEPRELYEHIIYAVSWGIELSWFGVDSLDRVKRHLPHEAV